VLLKGVTNRLQFEIENRRKTLKYVQNSLRIYYSVYISVRVFNSPDQGKAVRKLLKLLMTTFVKKGVERKKFNANALCNIHIIWSQHNKVLASITAYLSFLKKICPASFCENCQCLKFLLNGLRVQSRVSSAVELSGLPMGEGCGVQTPRHSEGHPKLCQNQPDC